MAKKLKKLFCTMLVIAVLATIMSMNQMISYAAIILRFNFTLNYSDAEGYQWGALYSKEHVKNEATDDDDIKIIHGNADQLESVTTTITLSGCPDNWNRSVTINGKNANYITPAIPKGYVIKDIDFGKTDNNNFFFTCELKPVSDKAPAPAPAPKKEAPAEPPTPEEELRAAEEEALPLAIVETDKNQVAKDDTGIVPDKAYNLSAYVTTKGFVSALNKIVKANAEAKSVSIYTGKAFTFNKGIVEAINKGGKEVVYYFKHAGHIYSVTVPANVDAAKVLEANGHAGPLYVGKVLGTTSLVK